MPYFKDNLGHLHFLSDTDVEAGFTSVLPDGCTQISDEEAKSIANPAPTLEQVKSAQSADIDAAYQVAAQSAISFTTAAAVTERFQADPVSQSTLLTAFTGYNATGEVPDGFYWKAEDNSLVPFTLADLKGLYQVMLAQGWSAFQKRVSLKEAIAAAKTVEAVQAVVWE